MSNEIAVQKETGNGKPMVSWAALLNEAVTKPGFIHEAYSRFHNYSLGNQLLALFQCLARGIQPGPLATFPRWKELGRHVKRGESFAFSGLDIRPDKREATLAGDQPAVTSASRSKTVVWASDSPSPTEYGGRSPEGTSPGFGRPGARARERGSGIAAFPFRS